MGERERGVTTSARLLALLHHLPRAPIATMSRRRQRGHRNGEEDRGKPFNKPLGPTLTNPQFLLQGGEAFSEACLSELCCYIRYPPS
jgi:hypothetical protein